MTRQLRALAAAALAALALLAVTARADAAAPPPPSQDPFYSYTGATPLSQIAPGTVLKTRTTSFHVAGIALPITVVQLLYRSTDAQNRPETNVTSVLEPPHPSARPQLVGYGSFYDSLSNTDEPSYVFNGAPYTSGHELPTIETAVIAPVLLAGDAVSVADTEGQNADFAAGPEYGTLTLDGLRAALASPATGVASPATRVALMGYSGGAIATGWAAQMAPRYAPDVQRRLVGAALGGVLVEPAHNLHYVDGSKQWAGVMPMALIGISRAYGADLRPYLSAYGLQVFNALQHAPIGQAEDDYPYLAFTSLVKPRYAVPESIPLYVKLANKLILGHDALPRVPLYIQQGTGGQLDGTQPSPTYGAGDGVMIAGDVRSYAREVCGAGQPVDYTQAEGLSHELVEPGWTAGTVAWLAARFAGAPAPSDCATIAPGNSLAPITLQRGG